MNTLNPRRTATACLLGMTCLALSAVVSAAPPTPTDTGTRADARLQAEARLQQDADRDCMRYTGTRITTRAMREQGKDCVVANGRVHSRADLERTGQVDIAQALRRLDPAIR